MSRLGELARRWIRQVKRLLHMMVGLAFMVLAVAGAMLTLAEWQTYRAKPSAGLTYFAFFLGFTIFLVILSLYTFLKARSVR